MITMAKTLLIVDNEKSIRDSSNRLLRFKGYEILTAENGQKVQSTEMKQ
jgi:DNA-binding NtrC family response regulator